MQLIQEALLTLLKLTAYPEAFQTPAATSLCGPLVRLVQCGVPDIEKLAVMAIGNSTTHSDSLGISLVQHGLFDSIASTFSRSQNLRELCWLLSNLAMCGHYALTELLRGGLFEAVFALTTSNDFSVATEAVWTVLNAMIAAGERQLDELVAAGVVRRLVEVLKVASANLQFVVLDGLNKVVEKLRQWKSPGEFYDVLNEFIGDCRGSIIEEIAMSSNERVSELALLLISNACQEDAYTNFYDY